MRRLARRELLLLLAGLPLLSPTSASAALKLPTRVAPARVRPLGVWRIANSRPEADPGVPAVIELSFRSAIDVADPYISFWPSSLPVAPFPPPATPNPDVPYLPTPIPLGHPRRPVEVPLGEPLTAGVVTPIFITVGVGASTCPNRYAISCQISDGTFDDPATTRRRASFTFVLKVRGTACVRPTPIPHLTKTPKLPPAPPTRTRTPVP